MNKQKKNPQVWDSGGGVSQQQQWERMGALLAQCLSRGRWLPMALNSFDEIQRNLFLLYHAFLLFFDSLFMHIFYDFYSMKS